jgi:hypothetical protein
MQPEAPPGSPTSDRGIGQRPPQTPGGACDCSPLSACDCNLFAGTAPTGVTLAPRPTRHKRLRNLPAVVSFRTTRKGGSLSEMQQKLPDHETEEIAKANETGRTPVVFVHDLWLLPSSWDRWATVFEEAG